MSLPSDPTVALAGLYVHVPFCAAICPYCDFAVRRGDAVRRLAYVAALEREAELWWAEWTAPIDTVYFGGGTPSQLEPELLERLLARLRALLPITGDASVTLEVNPEDVDPPRLAAWRRLGVRSVSLGVQSFADERLAFLGRGHRGAVARAAVAATLAAGFASVSVDLIYGLPDEAAAAWDAELATAASLGVPHLSCYQLTVHEGTRFGWLAARGELRELDDLAQGERFRRTHSRLAALGYEGYEVSNFARAPQFRSRHNRKYWHHVPYLGLGPAAHSFAGDRRWWNERTMTRWEVALRGGTRPVAGGESLGARELAAEMLLLGLRTREGVDLARLRAQSGYDVEQERGEILERLREEGLARDEPGRLALTLDGWAVADGIAATLAP